jgi:drug/metabolite transporter (DMT)-like permease
MTKDIQAEGALKAWGFLIVLALIWGSSFILIKRGLEVFSPGEVGAFRIVAAGMVLLPLSLPRLKGLKKRQVKNLVIVGLMGSFIPAFLFAKAQTQLSSSLTGVFNAMTPLFVVIIGALFFNATITRRNSIGLAIAFVGVVILLMVKEGTYFGDFSEINSYAFLCAACLSLLWFQPEYHQVPFRRTETCCHYSHFVVDGFAGRSDIFICLYPIFFQDPPC